MKGTALLRGAGVLAGLALALAGCGSGGAGTHSTGIPSAGGSKAAEPLVVHPGQSVGQIELTRTFAQVTAAIGQPTTTEVKETGGPPAILANWATIGLSGLFHDANDNGRADATEQCVMAYAESPYVGKTTDGFGLGSTREAIESAWGQPDQKGASQWYLARGIVLVYYADGTVASMGVFGAQTDTPEEARIVPGKGLGAIWVGATYSAASSRYGSPTRFVPVSDAGVVYAFWAEKGLLACYDDADVDETLDATERCVFVWGAVPFGGRTNLGAGPDTPKAKVREIYGAPEEEESARIDWYWSRGMVFNYDENGVTDNVGIFSPIYEDGTEVPAGAGWEIVPGERVGPVKVGVTMADVVAVLGQPDANGTRIQQAGSEQAVVCIWPLSRVSAAFPDANGNGKADSEEVVRMAWARMPYAGRTEEGIGTDSNKAKVHNAFGMPEEESGRSEWHWSRGIVFNYLEDDGVMSIGVFGPVTRSATLLDLAAGSGGVSAEFARRANGRSRAR